MTKHTVPSLIDVVLASSTVVVGRVVRWDMIDDATGLQTTGRQGPGEGKHIRHHVRVSRVVGETFMISSVKAGDTIVLPISGMMHHQTLSAPDEVSNEPEQLYFLSFGLNRWGESVPVTPAQLAWPLSDEAKVKDLFSKRHILRQVRE